MQIIAFVHQEFGSNMASLDNLDLAVLSVAAVAVLYFLKRTFTSDAPPRTLPQIKKTEPAKQEGPAINERNFVEKMKVCSSSECVSLCSPNLESR